MLYGILTVLLLMIIFFVYRESTGYNIVEYTVTTDKDIPSPVRFVMLSDLHDTDVTHDDNERLLQSVLSADPDFVVFAGDMITTRMNLQDASAKTLAFMKRLADKCRVYYGLGNHEQRYRQEPDRYPGRFEELIGRVESYGIKVLSDSCTDIDDKKIRIYGFDIPMVNYRRAVTLKLPDDIVSDTLGRCDKDRFNILIAHTPDFFEDYVKFAPDLILSGHLHGGIVALPGIGGIISPQVKLFPRYDSGKFEKDGVTMIVSRGIGWHSIPIRIFNRAEIVSVTIKSNKDRGEKDGDQR